MKHSFRLFFLSLLVFCCTATGCGNDHEQTTQINSDRSAGVDVERFQGGAYQKVLSFALRNHIRSDLDHGKMQEIHDTALRRFTYSPEGMDLVGDVVCAGWASEQIPSLLESLSHCQHTVSPKRFAWQLTQYALEEMDPHSLLTGMLPGGEAAIDFFTPDDLYLFPTLSPILFAATNYVILTIPDFRRGASVQLAEKIMEELRAHPAAQGIVLDLSYNPGGYLEEAVPSLGLFLNSGPVCKIEKRIEGGIHEQLLESVSHPNKISIPLLTLISSRTASAGELVAGALRDRGATVLAGGATYGKGTGQEIFELSQLGIDSGGYFLLTNFYYFLPSGKSPQCVGVVPDVGFNYEVSDPRGVFLHRSERSYRTALSPREVAKFAPDEPLPSWLTRLKEELITGGYQQMDPVLEHFDRFLAP